MKINTFLSLFSGSILLLMSACTSTNSITADQQNQIITNKENVEKHEQEIQSLFLRVDELGGSDEQQAYKDNQQLLQQIMELKAEVKSLKENSGDAEIARLNRELLTLKNSIAQLRNKKTTKPTPKKTPTTTQEVAEVDLYEKARDFYVNKDFQSSASLFREFLKKYPSHKFASNSQYWLGECYYSLEDFSAALNEFQKVVDFYKDSSKAPDAQIKIAFTYRQIGENQQAKIELKRVLTMYPKYERKDFVKSLLKEF